MRTRPRSSSGEPPGCHRAAGGSAQAPGRKVTRPPCLGTLCDSGIPVQPGAGGYRILVPRKCHQSQSCQRRHLRPDVNVSFV